MTANPKDETMEVTKEDRKAAESLAIRICSCATAPQHKADVQAVLEYRAEALATARAEIEAEIARLREALHLAASRLLVASVDAIRAGETRLSADCITWANDATRAALAGDNSHERV